MSATTVSHVSTGFRRLALGTAVVIYLLINVGGIVRVTHSGLGCPDWPLCYGQVVPLENDGITTIIEFSHRLVEFSHRLVAGLGGLLLLATALWAWRSYRHNRRLVWFSTAALVLTPLQFALGGIVVLTDLEPLTVLVHLGTALIIFACSLVVAVETYRPRGIPGDGLAPGYQRWLWIGAAAVFALVVLGALVVGTGSSLACQDWPLCYNQLLPADQIGSTGVLLHVAHRYLAGLVGLYLLWLVWYSRRQRAVMPGMANWALILLGAFAAQVIIGGVKIWSGEATVLRALHLAAAAAVWAVLIVMLAMANFRRQAALTPADEPAPAPGRAATMPGR